MGTMASQITNLTIVYSTVYSDADQRKHRSSAALVFLWGIRRWPVNFPHKSPIRWKMFPFVTSSWLRFYSYPIAVIALWRKGTVISVNVNRDPVLHSGLVKTLRRRHNGHDGVSNHQPHHCLLNRLFTSRSKKTSKLRVTGLWAGNSPGTGGSPHIRKNVSIWWRHHEQFPSRWVQGHLLLTWFNLYPNVDK